MAERWAWEETTTDWRTAIDRKDIDAVDISLPNHLHAPVAIAAAAAGKIVMCEKPLALTVDEAVAMADSAKNVPTMVWFNYRRVPAIAYARQLIDEGRLGTIYHYDAAYRQQWGADLSRAATWRMDPALAGSGVADDLLTHLLDTALYLNGPMTEGVATTRTFALNRKVDDAFLAMVKFENGSLGTFDATRFGIGCKNANAFQIHGSGGMLRFNLERLNHLEFVDASDPSTEQGPRDLLVTDIKHPIFPNFWRPGTSSATSTRSSLRWPSFSTASSAATHSIPIFLMPCRSSARSARCRSRPERSNGQLSAESDELSANKDILRAES